MIERLGRARAAIHEETSEFDLRLWIATAICRSLPPLVGNRLRSRALRFAGVRVGWATTFGGPVKLSGPARPASRLTVGQRCWINAGCTFDASARIDIGNDVAFGPEVMIITNSHHIGPSQERAGSLRNEPVRVGSGTWVGARATILPGVEIGPGCIVAAGSVVTRSVEPDTLVAGVPAVIVRRLDTTKR